MSSRLTLNLTLTLPSTVVSPGTRSLLDRSPDIVGTVSTALGDYCLGFWIWVPAADGADGGGEGIGTHILSRIPESGDCSLASILTQTEAPGPGRTPCNPTISLSIDACGRAAVDVACTIFHDTPGGPDKASNGRSRVARVVGVSAPVRRGGWAHVCLVMATGITGPSSTPTSNATPTPTPTLSPSTRGNSLVLDIPGSLADGVRGVRGAGAAVPEGMGHTRLQLYVDGALGAVASVEGGCSPLYQTLVVGTLPSFASTVASSGGGGGGGGGNGNSCGDDCEADPSAASGGVCLADVYWVAGADPGPSPCLSPSLSPNSSPSPCAGPVHAFGLSEPPSRLVARVRSHCACLSAAMDAAASLLESSGGLGPDAGGGLNSALLGCLPTLCGAVPACVFLGDARLQRAAFRALIALIRVLPVGGGLGPGGEAALPAGSAKQAAHIGKAAAAARGAVNELVHAVHGLFGAAPPDEAEDAGAGEWLTAHQLWTLRLAVAAPSRSPPASDGYLPNPTAPTLPLAPLLPSPAQLAGTIGQAVCPRWVAVTALSEHLVLQGVAEVIAAGVGTGFLHANLFTGQGSRAPTPAHSPVIHPSPGLPLVGGSGGGGGSGVVVVTGGGDGGGDGMNSAAGAASVPGLGMGSGLRIDTGPAPLSEVLLVLASVCGGGWVPTPLVGKGVSLEPRAVALQCDPYHAEPAAFASSGGIEHCTEGRGAVWLRGCCGGFMRGPMTDAEASPGSGPEGGAATVLYPRGGHVLLPSTELQTPVDAFPPLSLAPLEGALSAASLPDAAGLLMLLQQSVGLRRAGRPEGPPSPSPPSPGGAPGQWPVPAAAQGAGRPSLATTMTHLRCLLVQAALHDQRRTQGDDAAADARLLQLLAQHLPRVAELAGCDPVVAIRAAYARTSYKGAQVDVLRNLLRAGDVSFLEKVRVGGGVRVKAVLFVYIYPCLPPR